MTRGVILLLSLSFFHHIDASGNHTQDASVTILQESRETTSTESGKISTTEEQQELGTPVSSETSTKKGGNSSTDDNVASEVLSDYLPVTSVSSEPRLEVRYTSAVTGFIQTPGYDKVVRDLPFIDDWTRVVVPSGHVAMVSLQEEKVTSSHKQTHCDGDKLSLHIERDSEPGTPLGACDLQESQQVLDSDSIHVHFVNDKVRTSAGFKLLFSFHNRSSLPERVPSGKWNCSVRHWTDFQEHFPCDLRADCLDAEDEKVCPYWSDACGPGMMAVAGKCHEMVEQDSPMTWEEAAVECRRRGAYLTSLNTPEEWDGVLGLLAGLEISEAFVGLSMTPHTESALYRYAWQWSDGSVMYYSRLNTDAAGECAAYTYRRRSSSAEIRTRFCHDRTTRYAFCENDDASQHTDHKDTAVAFSLRVPATKPSVVATVVECPSGHVTHNFLACDVSSACWDHVGRSGRSCSAPLGTLPPSFACANGFEHVPYMLVCDFRPDCRDASDEEFCRHPPCEVTSQFHCGNGQCVWQVLKCDHVEDCVNEADEKRCCPGFQKFGTTTPPPAIVTLSRRGSPDVQDLHDMNSSCPESHFQCPGDGYCLPVYVRCNGVYDCPGKEDETACDSYTCPGFYRCRASRICVHADHLCDDVHHCPQRDDELLCGFSCPTNCTCYGQAFVCTQSVSLSSYSNLRFLDARGTGMTPADVSNNSMLVYLGLAGCGVFHLDAPSLPNLQTLDVSDNLIRSISVSDLRLLGSLKVLNLAGNPLSSLFPIEDDLQQAFPSLTELDLSRVHIVEFDVRRLRVFTSLQHLNMSDSQTERVLEEGFKGLKHLRVLDLRGCPMTEFPRGLFEGLDKVEEIFSDNYKLCCPEVLGFSQVNCRAPSDEISSCEALLRSDLYRVVLSVFAALALVGNLGSFVYRAFVNRAWNSTGFGVFVTHLCVSDFLMGVYLAIIGVADLVYKGTYLWNDVKWKVSGACKAAGFLALLSSEVSAFIICLVTLDRFLVLRFPFSRLHFKKHSAHLTSALVWTIGLVLAGVPLLPVTWHWAFYSQTGICIPLPITRNNSPGRSYSFSVMIVLNFVLFLLIAAGQVFIYSSIRANSMSVADASRKSRDLAIARRLLSVVVSDFLCWFPIGFLGLLASYGTPIPSEVSVAIAVFVLPVNSALNPFLYTLNAVRERRRKAASRQAMSSSRTVGERSKTSAGTYSESQALELLETWLNEGVVSREGLRSRLSTEKEDSNVPVGTKDTQN